MSGHTITIDFENPAHQRLLASAINDPGHYVPRADHYREALVYWQMRAINEAFDPSPPLYIQAASVPVAEQFTREHSLGERNRHWFYATGDGLRARTKIRLIQVPGYQEGRHNEEIDALLVAGRLEAEILG